MKLLVLAGLIALLSTAGVVLSQDDNSETAAVLSLNANSPMDPFLVTVIGGGSTAAHTLSEGCSGYVSESPTAVINVSDLSENPLRIFLYSNADTVLVVQTPDGSTLCADDQDSQVLDPSLDIDDAPEGEYRIWAGSFDAAQWVPTFLVLTRQQALTPSTLDLSRLVTRGVGADANPTAAPSTLRSDESQRESLSDSQLPLVQENVSAGGDLLAFARNMVDPACAGFISAQPAYEFDWNGEADTLHIFFESSADTTLLVAQPDGTFVCSDDSNGTDNLNPGVEISDPASGSYAVFVGSFNPDTMETGTLTITTDAGDQPEALSSGE